MADEAAPLLPSSSSSSRRRNLNSDGNSHHRLTLHWHSTSPFSSSSSPTSSSHPPGEPSDGAGTSGGGISLRPRARRFLTSRWGHYFVLGLVGIDVGCILAGFLVNIFQCERRCKVGGDGGTSVMGEDESEALDAAAEVFEVVSLVISCLFMVELLASLWAFGLWYLKSWFHMLDATVIIAAFVVDVCLKGVIEEAGSVIIVLRLWRVFKIIEELSAGAEEQTDVLNEHIEKLMSENKDLRRRIAAAQATED